MTNSKTINTAQFNKMTCTPVAKLVVTLAVPSVISMLVTNIYNLADTAFVGTLGNSASGAVGVVFGFMAILQAVGFMFGQGSGSIVARLLGAKDVEEAGKIASTGFFGAVFLGAAVALGCFVFLDPLVMMLGSTQTIAPYAKTYIRFILLTAPCMVSSFTLNNILRYEGKAALGMIGLMAGGVLNIAGDAVLIFGFDLGIAGAGISTAVSQAVSFLILLSMFLRGKTSSRLSIRKAEMSLSKLGLICGTGFPSLVRQTLGSAATILLNFEAAKYGGGDPGVAAMSIVSRISFFVFAIALGIGQGFQPVCGFNFGAKKYKRVREAYKTTLILASGILIVLTCISLGFSNQIIRLFRDDDIVVELAKRAFRLISVAQIFLSVCMVTEMLMQSSGERLKATFLSSLRGGILFIPSLLILSSLRGIEGVQEAQPLSYVLSVIPAVILAIRFFNNLPKTDENA